MNATLACPRCHQPLELAHRFHVCRACRGGFVADVVLHEMVAAHPGAEVRYRPRDGAAVGCPTCGAETLAVAIEDVPVDRCVGHGIWFDADELGEVMARTSARAPRVTTAVAAVHSQDTVEVVDFVDLAGDGVTVVEWLVEVAVAIFD